LPEDSVGPAERTRYIRNVAGDRSYFQRSPCVERWLRNKAPLTRKRYPSYLNRFQLLTGLTPERFLDWCKTVEPVEVQDLIDRTSLDFKPAIQFCYRVAMRSFLHHNGYSLPKAHLQYVSQAWHRGYKREEIQTLLSHLRKKHHRLFVLMAAESGLRSHVIMELAYRHVMEDLENGIVPVAVRLEPRLNTGKKAAGYTFLGECSIALLRDCLSRGLIEKRPDARLIPRSYYGVWAAIHRASRKAELDPRIQTCHGFRKYFENALDDASIDHEKKMIIEGHLAGTRAKHYTDRDIKQLRDLYRRAYPFIRLSIDESVKLGPENETNNRRFADLEARLDRQRVLEAKLTVLEDELDQLKQFRDRIEQAQDAKDLDGQIDY